MKMQDTDLPRRAILKGGAGLVIGLCLPMGMGRALAQSAAPAQRPMDPNAFVRIGTDDIVTVLVKHIEFGQGPFTGLPTLVAEELDADWSQIRAEHAPSNVALYANLFMSMQATGGSTALANSYEQMRRAGATARAMLVEAAAQSWGVKASEITVDRGVIRHAASGKKGRFGQFAEAAAKLPAPQQVTLKDPSAFRLIGKEKGVGRPDTVAKVNGTAQYTIDIHEPGMLTVVVARPERFGGKLVSFDATEALKVKGVVAVKQLLNGVAVYAKGMWPALKGRSALKLKWDDSAAEMRSSDRMIADYRALAAKPGKTAAAHGDVDAVLRQSGEVIEAEYVFPYLAHAPMEPLDGYLKWNAQGAHARLGAQFQTGDQMTIAQVLGLKPEQVRLETLFAGGSFGRRAQADEHFAVELAQVARAIGPDQPVKLVWTREDDIRGGYYRPMFVHRLRGAVKNGQITAWSNTVVGQSLAMGTPLEQWMVKDGIDGSCVEGARELLYDLPAFRCDLHMPVSPVSVLWWRSVGHTHTAYAVECFVDQLLEKAGADPVKGRLAMMGKSPRAAGVLKAVAELADWTGYKVPKGRARGVAVVESFNTFVAEIAEVSIDENGEPRVHKVWAAVDCGVAVNPDVIRAQMEGGIGFALGHALYAEVPFDKGIPAVSNFDGYRSLRMPEMPEVEVMVVKSAEKPSGIGEPGVPPLAPAVANALARLGRARPAQLPMVKPA